MYREAGRVSHAFAFASFFFFSCYQVELHGMYDGHGKSQLERHCRQGYASGLFSLKSEVTIHLISLICCRYN